MATMARWWCALNGWRWPADLPAPPGADREDRRAIAGAWAVVNALAHDEGLALWRERYHAGLCPSTGESTMRDTAR